MIDCIKRPQSWFLPRLGADARLLSQLHTNVIAHSLRRGLGGVPLADAALTEMAFLKVCRPITAALASPSAKDCSSAAKKISKICETVRQSWFTCQLAPKVPRHFAVKLRQSCLVWPPNTTPVAYLESLSPARTSALPPFGCLHAAT